MTRDYWLRFGSGNPALTTGLNPTFITFVNGSGVTLVPPSIVETYVGTGLYKFTYGATETIAFTVDGATTGLSPADRYVSGVVDPMDMLSIRVGFTSSSYGDTAVDPSTVFGFLKRAQEFWEGNEVYTKGNGILQFFTRGAGNSNLLREKIINDTISEVTKE